MLPRNLPLRLKICIAPAMLVLTLVGLACYALLLLQTSDQRLDQLSAAAFDRMGRVAALDRTMAGIQARLYRFTSLSMIEPGSAKAVGAEVSVELARLPRLIDDIGDGLADGQLKALVSPLNKTVADYTQAVRQVIDAGNDPAHAMAFINAVQNIYQQYDVESAQLAASVKGRKSTLVQELEDQTHQARLVFIGITITAALGAIAITVLLGHMIARPVVRLTNAMRQLAAGETRSARWPTRCASSRKRRSPPTSSPPTANASAATRSSGPSASPISPSPSTRK
jgi:hypothetical protein